MAVEDTTLLQKPSKNVYFVIWDAENQLAWDSFDDTFKPVGSAISPYLPAIEQDDPGGSKHSLYVHTLDWSRVNDDRPKYFWVGGYFRTGVTPDLAVDPIKGHVAVLVERGQTRLFQEDIEGIIKDTGTGSVLVDQDYGGTNYLCYTVDGVPVDNAEIRAYLEADYLAGRTATKYVKAVSRTTVDGSWILPMMLDPGDYILQFHKQGEAGPDAYKVTVLP